MPKVICGIDVGMSGSIVILVDGQINALHITPTFTTESIKNRKKKKTNHLNVEKIYKILNPLFVNNKPEIYVEEVTHLFGLPSTSNFKLGYSAGVIHGILQTLGDFYLIGPKRWQQIWEDDDRIYITKNNKKKLDTKATSLKCARRLYPEHDLLAPGGRVPHDGCIDALLIATYGSNL